MSAKVARICLLASGWAPQLTFAAGNRGESDVLSKPLRTQAETTRVRSVIAESVITESAIASGTFNDASARC